MLYRSLLLRIFQKQDYDDFVNMIQEKLQQLEIEKAEIKKAIAEKQAAIKISAILEKLKTFLNFNTLTTEMLLRFIEKIEVEENKDVKIYYKIARLRVYNPLNHFLKLTMKHTPHVSYSETCPPAVLPSSHIRHLPRFLDPLLRLMDYKKHRQSASVPYRSSLAGSLVHSLYVVDQQQ